LLQNVHEKFAGFLLYARVRAALQEPLSGFGFLW